LNGKLEAKDHVVDPEKVTCRWDTITDPIVLGTETYAKVNVTRCSDRWRDDLLAAETVRD
jgi:hypothetical protein